MKMRACSRCKQELPVEEFPLRRKPGTDRYYRWSYCKSCTREKHTEWARAHPEKIREQARSRYWADPERFKEDGRRRRRAAGVPERRSSAKSKMFDLYGITREEYFALKERQGGRCAICREEPGGRRLAVDHDHATGRVRGLLCGRCNMGLGAYRDNVALLRQAIAYLEMAAT